jgi:hypothetical protein
MDMRYWTERLEDPEPCEDCGGKFRSTHWRPSWQLFLCSSCLKKNEAGLEFIEREVEKGGSNE